MRDEKQIKRISKFLSLVLRHAPEKIDLQLDEGGWANVDELLQKMNKEGKLVNMEILELVVESNNKKRFSFSEDKKLIRANQGHSIKIDHGFEAITPPEFLYHGTAEKNLQSILRSGLDKRKRHHVHLSEDKETAIDVGGRHGKPIVLIIKAQEMHVKGHEFYRSENGVWLTDHVPVDFIGTPY